MVNFAFLDWFWVVAFIVLMTICGILFYKLGKRSMADFFLAAREMGWSGSWQVTGFDPAQVAKAHAIPDGYEVLGIYKR